MSIKSGTLHTKAADQLGSDQAPVRLTGLYALERLAHSTVEHRQTIVDVICAYLRMPYTPPPETPQAGDRYRGPRPRRRRQSLINDHHSRSVPTPTDRHQQPHQERQVRLTAQDILARNLCLPPESRRRWWDRWRRVYREPPWPGIRLELAGALLLDFHLSACTLARADFTGAQFVGVTSFGGTQFGLAFFDRAQFTGPASFDRAQFTGLASFDGAQFSSTASMAGPQFTNKASVGAYFTSKAFDTYFTSMASFDATFADAQFAGWTNFHNARFAGWTHFQRARFPGWASFEGAQFTSPAFFDDARFTDRVSFDHARFTGPARFRGAQFTGLASFKNAQFSFTAAQFPGLSPLACLQFTGPVDFAGAHISGPGMETVLPPGWKTRPAQLDKGEDPAARYLIQSEDPAG